MDDQKFMEMALELALRGRGFTSPNPMVGSVVVRDDKVVGVGYHQAAGQAHAEVIAIDDAGTRARGATLYVNLEPCNHTGRTPPCTQKIIEAGIRRVVVAMKDPNPKVKGGGIQFLERNGIRVSVGVCAEAAKKLNEVFIKFVSTGRPFTLLKCAATLDGRIATRTGDSKWVTGEKSREFVHQLRHTVDAILVGINTVKKDDPSLTTRLAEGRGRDPVRIILDTNLCIPPDARVLRLDSNSDTILVAARPVSEEKRAALEKDGVRILDSQPGKGLIDMRRLVDQLGAMGITSLLIEGGSRVAASALEAGIVDKIMFFYAPKISGGDDGVPICRGKGPEFMDDCIQVSDIAVRRFGDDVMVEGYIEKG